MRRIVICRKKKHNHIEHNSTGNDIINDSNIELLNRQVSTTNIPINQPINQNTNYTGHPVNKI